MDSVSGQDSEQSRLSLVCSGGEFVEVGGQGSVSVAGASCSRKQEPRLLRSSELCSEVGADGRTTGEENSRQP